MPRPVHSEIRQNMIDILYHLGIGYGYQIYQIYRSVFPSCTSEVIYYHLKKGLSLGEFQVEKTSKEKGDYSWGPVAEKTYYSLGKNAKPRTNRRVAEHIRKHP